MQRVEVVDLRASRALLRTSRGLLVAEVGERPVFRTWYGEPRCPSKPLHASPVWRGVEHTLRLLSGGGAWWEGEPVEPLAGEQRISLLWRGAGEVLPAVMRADELGAGVSLPRQRLVPAPLLALLRAAHEAGAEALVGDHALHAQRLHWASLEETRASVPIVGAQGEMLPPLRGVQAPLRMLLLCETGPEEVLLRELCESLVPGWRGTPREILETARALLREWAEPPQS